MATQGRWEPRFAVRISTSIWDEEVNRYEEGSKARLAAEREPRGSNETGLPSASWSRARSSVPSPEVAAHAPSVAVDDESEQPLDQRSGALEIVALGGIG